MKNCSPSAPTPENIEMISPAVFQQLTENVYGGEISHANP